MRIHLKITRTTTTTTPTTIANHTDKIKNMYCTLGTYHPCNRNKLGFVPMSMTRRTNHHHGHYHGHDHRPLCCWTSCIEYVSVQEIIGIVVDFVVDLVVVDSGNSSSSSSSSRGFFSDHHDDMLRMVEQVVVGSSTTSRLPSWTRTTTSDV